MKKIPYIVHEAAMQRLRDSMKRMSAALILLLVLLVISNAAWILK